MKVIIGVPSFNGYFRVDWLLNSIWVRSNEKDREILKDSRIVVCDDSGSSHAEKVKSVVERWKNDLNPSLIINERNLGVASSWNRIVRSEKSDYVILINDDIIVSKGWLDALLGFLEANPKAGSASLFCYFITSDDVGNLLSNGDAIVTPRDPFTKAANVLHSELNEHPGRVMAAAGCSFGFRRDKWEEIGGFDENYFSFYEEADFGTSLAAKGYPSYCLCWPRCYHIWSATFGSAPEIKAGDIMIRSREYYTKKWQGHTETTHPRYMDKIPFQRVKWRYKGQEFEDLIRSDHGYDE